MRLQLEALLDDGVRDGLFSGGAVAVAAPSETFAIVRGRLADDDPAPVTTSSLFDLASLTKCYVAYAACALVRAGRLDLDEPVARFLDVGLGRGARGITPRMLLTHTAGFPEESSVWREGGGSPRPGDVVRVVRTPLIAEPGTRFQYSCVGFVALGALLERVEDAPLEQILADRVLDPLDLGHTRFGPVPASRALATEAEPWLGRGTVRGEVHDELAWHLGGVAGNAGLFAPVDDVLRFAMTFAEPAGAQRDIVELMRTRESLPVGAAFRHGLGIRIGDPAFMATGTSYGHTGFTGTMWVADPDRETTLVLLTNRVHKGRDRVDLTAWRRRAAEAVAGQPRIP